MTANDAVRRRGGARPGVAQAPSGRGNVTCATDRRGRVTCYGRVRHDGTTYRAKGVTVRPGVTLAAAKRLAGEHLRALIRDLERDRPPDPVRDATTLAGWVEQWAPEKREHIEAGTWERYADLLEHHVLPALGHLRLTAIRPPVVLAWREWMRTPHGPRNRPAAATDVRAAEALLRLVLKAARVREHAVSEAVLEMPHVKTDKTETPAFTAAQFLALLEVAEEPWRTMYVVAFFAMTRDAETRGLRWGRVLWASNQVDVAEQLDRRGRQRAPKWGSVGLVDVPAEAMAVLDAHRRRVEEVFGPVQPDDLVFTLGMRPIGYETGRRHLKADLRRAGLPSELGWHAFRRGGATAHAAAAVDPLTLRQLMRHSELRTTTGYLRPVALGGRAAAERMAEGVRRADHDATSS